MVEVTAGRAAGLDCLPSPFPSSLPPPPPPPQERPPLRRECYLVLLAGLYRAVVVFLYSCGRILVVGVIYIPFVLLGGRLQARSIFTTLSLSWPLVVNVYRHVLFAILEGTESQVAMSRIQVSQPAG